MPVFTSLSATLLGGLIVGYVSTAAVEHATRTQRKVHDTATDVPSMPEQRVDTTFAVLPSSVVVDEAPTAPMHAHSTTDMDTAEHRWCRYPQSDVVLPPRVTWQHERERRVVLDGQDATLVARFAQQCREAAVHGLPSYDHVRCYGSYIAALNYERRIPSWVLERVDASQFARRERRTSNNSSSSTGAQDGGKANTARMDVAPTTTAGDAQQQQQQQQRQQEHPPLSSVDTATTSIYEHAVSRRRSVFYADATVPEMFRVHPRDYTTRGLSRGHLAAAQLHMATQDDLDATFNMNANVVPQDMTVNALDWARLERLTRRLGNEVSGRWRQQETQNGGRGRLYVVSGPAFLPQWVCPFPRSDGGVVKSDVDATATPHTARLVMQYELTGPPEHRESAGIAVPTHLYKVLLAEHDTVVNEQPPTLRYKIAAFLMPNTPIAVEQPLTAYQVPLTRVEQVTGLQFFPHLPTHALPDLCASHTCDEPSPEYVKDYRDVAQLRCARSIPELNRTYTDIRDKTVERGGTLSRRVVLEHEHRREELAAMALRPVEDV